MSRILNRQRQLAEQGRLRLGYTVEGDKGPRPVKSTTWVVTSHSEEHVRAAAVLWGGEVERWQPLGNGAEQWRVITQSDVVDAVLPPGDPLTQSYEQWNRGGCIVRCDGVTEQFTGSPCVCQHKYGDQWFERSKDVCDSKSRLKVLLPDMPGLGSWRMETGSYYATDEIAGMVDTIRAAVGPSVLVPVRLRIEQRTRTAGGQTKQFVVPMLELRGVTAGALLAGHMDGAQQLGSTRQAAQIESGPIDVQKMIETATSVEELQAVWRRVDAAGQLDEWRDALIAAAGSIDGPDNAGSDDAAVEVEPDPDEVWQKILAAGGEVGMSLEDIEVDFAQTNAGLTPSSASGFELQAYLDSMQGAAAAETVSA